jgi:hypothetical protein
MLERYGPSYYYYMGLLLKFFYALFSFLFQIICRMKNHLSKKH